MNKDPQVFKIHKIKNQKTKLTVLTKTALTAAIFKDKFAHLIKTVYKEIVRNQRAQLMGKISSIKNFQIHNIH